MDLTEPCRGDSIPDPPLSERVWVGPIADRRVMPTSGDPAEEAETRESVRLALVAALQYLPPRQRAVLILREVLKWKASEVAELLDTSVVSVNSSLQRARTTLAERNVGLDDATAAIYDEQRELLARYVDAFERFDIDELVSLLHEDATMSMPPYKMWLRGAGEFGKWLRGAGGGCRGSRIAPVFANGVPAFAQWRPTGDGGYHAWSIHIPVVSGGRISAIDYFVDANLFPLFDLPVDLDG